MPIHEWLVKKSKSSGAQSMLPADFPIIVDDLTGIVCEPALLFLFDKLVQKKPDEPVINTAQAYAYDLKEWWVHLDEFSITWEMATANDLAGFCKVLRCTISPKTGQKVATTTIKRRTSTIGQYYTWARKEKIYSVNPPSNSLVFDKEAFEKLNLHRGAHEKQHVSVMEITQARSIMEALGPLPSERQQISGAKSSRDRIAAQIALDTGLRISEVCKLSRNQFQTSFEKLIDTKYYPISIVGKGRKRRIVDFPGWLIKEIKIYIDDERSTIISTTGDRTDALIINPISAMQHAGKRVSIRTIQRVFSEACVLAGQYLSREISKFNHSKNSHGVEKSSIPVTAPAFTFHDLRHTYAVWTYYARKRSGDSEPWLYIQKQLGHANLKTTLDTYLSSTREFEASMSDSYMDRLHAPR